MSEVPDVETVARRLCAAEVLTTNMPADPDHPMVDRCWKNQRAATKAHFRKIARWILTPPTTGGDRGQPRTDEDRHALRGVRLPRPPWESPERPERAENGQT